MGMGYSRGEIEESLAQFKYDDVFATYLLLGRKNNDVSIDLIFFLLIVVIELSILAGERWVSVWKLSVLQPSGQHSRRDRREPTPFPPWSSPFHLSHKSKTETGLLRR